MATAKINVDERVFICGKTGSGKTYLARQLTRDIRRLVVCDSKGTLGNWNLQPDLRESRDALKDGKPVRMRMLAPITDDAAAIEEYWQDVFHLAFEAQNCTVYIDEVYAIVPPGQRAPAIMEALWTRGRDPYHIGAWCATQRPSWIPAVVMSEAEHYFAFRLNLPRDRITIAGFMGDQVLEPISDKHGFYYMNPDMDEPSYIPIYREKGKQNGT